jgi:hypothetical protein
MISQLQNDAMRIQVGFPKNISSGRWIFNMKTGMTASVMHWMRETGKIHGIVIQKSSCCLEFMLLQNQLLVKMVFHNEVNNHP